MTSNTEDLTDEEAQQLLDKLSRHFASPVMPMRDYCGAFEHWLTALETNDSPIKWVEHIPAIRLAICKSSMLSRLLYAREPLRTEKCPEHKGHWSGLPYPGNDCEHGCDLTGWLPAKKVKN